MKTLTTFSFRRLLVIGKNPFLLLRLLSVDNLRSVILMCGLAAYAVFLYFIFQDALFSSWKYIPRRVVEACFVCLFCGITGIIALFSFFNTNRFTYLERACLLFIFATSVLFLFFRYPELFRELR